MSIGRLQDTRPIYKKKPKKQKQNPVFLYTINEQPKNRTLPKLIYIFNTISMKIPVSLFVEISKLVLKCIQKEKNP